MTTIYAGSFNGISWGGTSDNLRVKASSGFEDLPGIRVRAKPRSLNDGVFHGRFLLDEHVLQLTFDIVDIVNGVALGQTVDASCRALELATPRSRVHLPLYFDSTTKVCQAYVQNRTILRGKSNYARAVVQWALADPRVYVYPSVTTSTNFGSTPTLTNLGNERTFPIITVTGTCLNPVLTNTTSGLSVKLPISMSSGTLVVNFATLAVTLNGIRISETPSSDWWGLEPGANVMGFTADSHSGTAISVVWASAWA